MPVTNTNDLGLDKADRYTDEKETVTARALDKLNAAVGGYAEVTSGDADYTLDEGDASLPGESRTVALKLISTLTAARNIKIPIAAGTYRNRLFVIWNATAGGFKVTVKTTAGGSTGIEIPNGYCRLLFHDGTNVYGVGPETAPATGLVSPVKAARVYHSTTQSISNNTITALGFDSERFDTDVIHDTSTNNSRLICKTAGLYMIKGNCGFAANATGVRAGFIRLNGTTDLDAQTILNVGASLLTRVSVSTIYQLAVNDYVEFTVYQNSGGSLNTEQAANYSPEFMMARLGS